MHQPHSAGMKKNVFLEGEKGLFALFAFFCTRKSLKKTAFSANIPLYSLWGDLPDSPPFAFSHEAKIRDFHVDRASTDVMQQFNIAVYTSNGGCCGRANTVSDLPRQE